MRLLAGGTLIDGTGSPPIPNSAVLVNDDGRIEAVGHQDNIASPPGTETISIAGMTLLPGLIDCHDHLSSHGYDLMGRWGLNEPNSLQNIRTARVMEQTLLTGYTTVRDAGWLDAGFKLAVEEGLIPGPRLVVATSPISPTGGLADRCSPSGHHQPPSPDPNLPIGVANGVDQVRAMVREVVRVGADVVKFATTGGASSRQGHGPKDIEFGRDEIEALVNEAHALGKRVMCHALGGPGLRMAVEAGADSIEHGTYLDEDPDLIKMMADKGTFFVPTFTVYIFHGERGTPHGQARARAAVPPSHRERAACPGSGREGGGRDRCRGVGPRTQCQGTAMPGGGRNDPHAGPGSGDGVGCGMPEPGKRNRDCGERKVGGPIGGRWRPPAGHHPIAEHRAGKAGDEGGEGVLQPPVR